MNSLHDDLVRAGDAAPRSTLDLERLHASRDSKQKRRRVGATLVATSICLAVGWAAVSMLEQGAGRADVTTSPADEGSTGAPPTDVALADGQYAYSRVTSYYYRGSGELYVGSGRSTVEIWWATDDSGRITSSGNPNTDTSPFGYYPEPGVFAAGEFPFDERYPGLASFSKDPATLEQQLIDRLEPDSEPYGAFQTPAPGQAVQDVLIGTIRGLLRVPEATPELKAALFHVLTDQAGVDVIRDSNDPVGRAAIELRILTDDRTERVWFDAQSLQLMASEDVAVDGANGLLLSRTIIEEAGIAGSSSSADLLTPFFPSTNDAPPSPGPIPPPGA